MNTTGDMSCFSYTITAKTEEPIYLVPFGDVHRDHAGFSHDAWSRFQEEHGTAAQKRDGIQRVFMGLGDYLDVGAVSERKALKAANLHETTEDAMDNYVDQMLDTLAAEMEYMRGKLIGLGSGNHDFLFPDGTTVTTRLCHRLKARYLGACSYFKLRIRRSGTGSALVVKVFAHHGLSGGARTIGGSLNGVQNLEKDAIANIYLSGHDHQLNVGRKVILDLPDNGYAGKDENLFPHHQPIVVARTGSFVRSYVPMKQSEPQETPITPKRGDYVIDRAYPPSFLGAPVIIIQTHRDIEVVEGRKKEQNSFTLRVLA